MLKQYFVTTALFLLLACNTSNTFSNEENKAQEVRQTVETYCKIEFDGAWLADRWEVVKFSKKRKDERILHKDADASAFGLQDHYPFIVVASYDIKEIKVLSPKRATAQVLYRRVAHSASATGREWYLVADPMDNNLVTLNLVYDKNKWYVLDPPPPRISRDWLIEYYDAETKGASENSPRWLRVTKVLAILKSLP